jgi:hypothetical protein
VGVKADTTQWSMIALEELTDWHKATALLLGQDIVTSAAVPLQIKGK